VSGICALAGKWKARYLSGMQAHRAEAVLSEDGVITLRDIPFRRGGSCLDVPLVSVDAKILAYPHVRQVPNQA
jgi:hypothetical protein